MFVQFLADSPIQFLQSEKLPITTRYEPNCWLSRMLVGKDAMCKQIRDDSKVLYLKKKPGTDYPIEILDNAKGRPIWKTLHMQPMHRMHEFVMRSGSGRYKTNAYIAGSGVDVGTDVWLLLAV